MGQYLCQVSRILAHRSSRFAAYSASKAALNQAMRHMAAELKRKDDDTILLAIHPGEVATYVHFPGVENETYVDESR
jgi:NAD(P)-dependent dehydrogenase (short-subunit alcohol dehydrogenase family)